MPLLRGDEEGSEGRMIKLRAVNLIWKDEQGNKETINFGIGDDQLRMLRFLVRGKIVEISAPETAIIKEEEE